MTQPNEREGQTVSDRPTYEEERLAAVAKDLLRDGCDLDAEVRRWARAHPTEAAAQDRQIEVEAVARRADNLAAIEAFRATATAAQIAQLRPFAEQDAAYDAARRTLSAREAKAAGYSTSTYVRAAHCLLLALGGNTIPNHLLDLAATISRECRKG